MADELYQPPSFEDKYPSHIQARANEMLINGDPYQFFIDNWQKSYAVINDDTSIGAMTLCTISSTLISNSKGIHVKAGGASGFGKSAGVTTMFSLFPPDKCMVSSMSAKALYYMDLCEGTVLYIDDIDLSKVDIFTAIKQCTSSYQEVTKHTTGKKINTIPARIGWILSSVDNFDDEQLDSRFVEVEVDNGIEKQLAILEKQKSRERVKVKAGEIDDDTLVCHCIWDLLSEDGLYDIRIPYAGAIHWLDTVHPRSFQLFADLIRCIALYQIKQRECINGYYLATYEDFQRAKALYKKMEKSNGTKLNSKERAILEYLADKEQVSRADLIKHLSQFGYKQNNIITIIHGVEGKTGGLLNKVSGLQAEQLESETGGYSRWHYSYTGGITSDGMTDSIILTDKDAIDETRKWQAEML